MENYEDRFLEKTLDRSGGIKKSKKWSLGVLTKIESFKVYSNFLEYENNSLPTFCGR